MILAKPTPPAEALRATFNYDENTGSFTWAVDRQNNMTGKLAGKIDRHGYRIVRVGDWGWYLVHRLIWAYVHGETPRDMIVDHIDCNPANNSLSNLRLATPSQSVHNTRVSVNSTSGLKGVYRNSKSSKKPWRSQIQVRGKLIFLGLFETAEQASHAYRAAAEVYHGEFARAS